MGFANIGRLAATALAGLLASCAQVETTSADRFTATGELIALSGGDAGAPNACFTCHGLEGMGNGAGAPRLAGIGMGYLDRQLEAYADGRRQHEAMSWIAKRLSADDRLSVAAYYAALPPGGAGPGPELQAPQLWVEGDASRGLPACAACHGAAGEGSGPANPPLAGQPAVYLAEQIELWRLAKRRTDPGNMMLAISQRLTPREAQVLSAYAASLPAGPPHREFAAASRAARRDDPRNDASAPPPRATGPR